MNIRTALKEGIAQLRAARVDSFTLAAELLLLHVLGRDRTWLFTHPEDNLSEDEVHRFFASIERRAAGEPTQHLTGKQEFWSLEFEVTPDVLIPRRETEHVIEVALDRLALHELRAGRKQTTDGSSLLIADIGTGSGCIAVALAKELPAATICATDISAAALAVARRNAERHSVADRIRFLECKLLEKLEASAVGAQLHPEGKRRNADSLRGQDATLAENAPLATRDQSPVTNHQSPLFDLIVSNPPYIGRREAESLAREVREHEPQLALYGGEEGYEFYAELIAQTAQRLKPGGVLVLELGHNSLPAVQPLLDAPAWTNVAVTNDLAGIPRVIAAEKP